MRPLRYSINVTLDGCCDHRVISADEDLHRHAVQNLDQADALLFGRVTYEMMEAAWRPSARTGARPDWMEPFGRAIDAAKKYVVSSTLDRVDWNAELVRGNLERAVQELKRESGNGSGAAAHFPGDLLARKTFEDPQFHHPAERRIDGGEAVQNIIDFEQRMFRIRMRAR